MNSGFRLSLSKQSRKFLKKQEPTIQKRMASAIDKLLLVPPEGDIKNLKGEANLQRLRVGTYRIIFTIDQTEKMIYVLRIGNRGDIYK